MQACAERRRSLVRCALSCLHAVDVDGRWAWILGGRFLSAVSHHRCLDGSPLLADA